MASKGPPNNGKVSRVRPMQRAPVPRATSSTGASSSRNNASSTISSMSSSAAAPSSSGTPSSSQQEIGSSRQKQLLVEQATQIRELESQLTDLRKQNVHLHREMQEAFGLQQLKSKTVDALTKDLNDMSGLEKRLGDFLSTVEAESLEGVAEEIRNLRKKCLRSEEYLAECNEKYREAALRNQLLEESLSELKAELTVARASGGQAKDSMDDTPEDLKSLAKRNAALEQKCESLSELKDKIVKLEIEKRDLRAEIGQLKGKVSSLQRERKSLNERLTTTETESSAKLRELKEAQVRHLEMLSKLRRSHTKIDAKYKHLLKERTQWQSLFRTANGELSRSTESLASISSVSSSSVSRTSFFRDSSNLEEYNIHLESELVALRENLKIAEKEKERLEKKLKALAEQVIQDESLITELDQDRTVLVKDRDELRARCASLDEENIALQRNVEELREQLDIALFENNEMSFREDEAHAQLPRDEATMPPFDRPSKEANFDVEKLTDFVNNFVTEQERALISRLEIMDLRVAALTTQFDKAKSLLAMKDGEVHRQQDIIAELNRQVEVLKNNAESLAKDLGAEVRERSATELAKMQDEISAQAGKLKDYEKMQKVLKKALIENEALKQEADLTTAKIGAAETRIVQLENQLKCEQRLVTESNGKLNQRLRQAERENERLQAEFAGFEEQISDLAQMKNALAETEAERESLTERIASLENDLAQSRTETITAKAELKHLKSEHKRLSEVLAESSTRAESLKMTLAEKAQQIATLIKDLEGVRQEKSSLEHALQEHGEREQKNQKMAKLTDDIRTANHELQEVLREKASTIESLEKQIVDGVAEKQRQLDDLLEAQKNDLQLQEETRQSCVLFVDSLELRVDPSLSVHEMVPQITSAVLELMNSKTKQLEETGVEVKRLRSEVREEENFKNKLQRELDKAMEQMEVLKQNSKAMKLMEDRLNAMTISLDECHTKIEQLHKDLEEKDEKLKGKNQVIFELEKELSEKIATFDEMEKVFSLKGDEYKKVREMLVASEDEIKSLSSKLSSTESAVQELCSKLIPNINRDTAEMLSSLSERVDELLGDLHKSDEKSKVLEAALEAGASDKAISDERLSSVTEQIETLQAQLEETTESAEYFKQAAEKVGAELSEARDRLVTSTNDLEKLKADLDAVTTKLEAKESELQENLVEMTNLRKLLVESETIIRNLSEQRNAEIAKLMDKIQSIGRERESLDVRLKQMAEAQSEREASQASLSDSLADERNALLEEKRIWEKDRLQLEQRMSELEAEASGKCAELEELTKALAGKQSDMARFEEKLHALKERYGERVESLQKTINDLQKEKAEGAANLDAIRNELKAATTAKQELETSLANKCESLEVLRSEMDLLEGKVRETCSQYEDSLQKLTDREAEVRRLKDEIANAQMALSEKSEDVDSYHDHIRALAEEKIRLEAEAADLKLRIDRNSEEYQREALEMQQELSLMTERYNVKCHECERLSKDVATKAADVDVLTAKLLAKESDLSTATARFENLEKELSREKQSLQQQLAEQTAQKEVAFTTTKQLEEKFDGVTAQSENVGQELAEVKSKLEAALRDNERISEQLKDTEQTLRSLTKALNEAEEQMELRVKELGALRDVSTASQAQLSMELEGARLMLVDAEKRLRVSKEDYEEQLSSLRNQLSAQEKNGDTIQQTLREEMKALKSRDEEFSRHTEEALISLKKLRGDLEAEQKMNVCLRTEKDALEEEMVKLQHSLQEAQTKLAQTEHIIKDLEAARTNLTSQLELSASAIEAAQSGQGALREELSGARRSAAFLEEQIEKLREEVANRQRCLDELTDGKAALEEEHQQLLQKASQRKQRIRELQERLDAVERSGIGCAEQVESAQEEINALIGYRRLVEEVCEVLECGTGDPSRIIPLLRQHKTAIAHLGSGLLMVRTELSGQHEELASLRRLVACQRAELSVFVSDAGRQLLAAMSRSHEKDGQNNLVHRCLEVLRENNMMSLTSMMSSGTSQASGENYDRHGPNSFGLPLDHFAMHFQTFNGPTAQFVAEQQASSAVAQLKLMKLAAAMDEDDTAPHNVTDDSTEGDSGLHHHQLNGKEPSSSSTLVRIDPYETIKQQKILIHELMAKLETTKKVLDSEITRRKELDERVRLWLSDKRLHNAQVSFDVAQIPSFKMTNSGASAQREDNFDSASLLSSQAALIPETSLNVTRHFPSYVDSFIRWLITTAPSRPDGQNMKPT